MVYCIIMCENLYKASHAWTNLTKPTKYPSHVPKCTIWNRNIYIAVLTGALWDVKQARGGICGFRLLLSAVCNLSAMVVSMISLAANVAVVRVYHCQGPVPDWLQGWVQRLPCCQTTDYKPRLPCRSYKKNTIESLILSSLNSSIPNSAPAICEEAERSAVPNMAQIRMEWPDVARRLARILFIVFVGINIIYIGYFIVMWLV